MQRLFTSQQSDTQRQLTLLFNQLTSESVCSAQFLRSLSRCMLVSPCGTMHKLVLEAMHNKHQSELLVGLLRQLDAQQQQKQKG